ncbi:hypothetical protein [Pseudomonas mediterranea]
MTKPKSDKISTHGICYLKGIKLKPATTTNKDDDDRESLEHILPNALGGRLKTKYILSHGANRDLNEEIDKEFIKTFESFTNRLDISKDRKTSPSMRATHLDYDTEVIFKDGKYFPRKPFYDSTKKIIYADSIKSGSNYLKHLIKNGEISDTDQVEIHDDIAGQLRIPFSPKNSSFKRGFAKIAIGYATLHGISRQNIDLALDAKNKKILDKIILIPSVPTNFSENYFEENVHKSHNYPCHTLTLCGSQGILYCHVELFSTFHWYVLLSEKYDGKDIYETYTYDLINDKEITREEYLSSITLPTKLPLIQMHRKLDRKLFMHLSRTGCPKHIMDKYNHDKFYQLSNFVNRRFVYNKAIRLGIINPPD